MKQFIAIAVLCVASVAGGSEKSHPGGSLDAWLGTSYTVIQPVPYVATTVYVYQGSYPVRGNHWTYPGHSRPELIAHLLTDGIHRGRFTRAYLESLSYQELLSAHDDHHEGRLQGRYVNTTSRKEVRAEAKAAKAYGREVYQTRDGRHPGPVGSAFRSLFGVQSYGSCPGGSCPSR